MLGSVLMKRGKDGKDSKARLVDKDDAESAQGYSRFIAGEPPTDKPDTTTLSGGPCPGLDRLGLALLSGAFGRPKTYERLVSDLYTAGWTIKEVKELLDKGPGVLV